MTRNKVIKLAQMIFSEDSFKQLSVVVYRSLTPHGCGVEAYMDVFTASSVRHYWNLLCSIPALW